MTPIGGYFELECGKTPLYHHNGVYLNLCRSALRYTIRALGIKAIHIPYYTCHVVAEAVAKEGCAVHRYHIDSNLLPDKEFKSSDFIVYNNYFGVNSSKVELLSNTYPNLIVDNAQAFYAKPLGRAAIYSPRKFFGLPDGGILMGHDIPGLDIDTGHSCDVFSHLIKRIDCGPQAGYAEFANNDNKLNDYALEFMSPLTRSLMGNIDYQFSKARRIENFNYLKNRLNIQLPFTLNNDDVPMVLPLMVKNGDHLRNSLIEQQIFCARYWPELLETIPAECFEHKLAKNIVALPIDQRYTLADMDRIIECLRFQISDFRFQK